MREAEEASKRQRFRKWFQRYGLLTIFIPAMLPIPLPLKVFVISAAMCRTPLWTFVLVIVLGRCIRYFGETYLGVLLGDGAREFLRSYSWHLVGAALALLAGLYGLLRWTERRRARATDCPICQSSARTHSE